MAIYLPNERTLILHIPKCAGFWVEEALARIGATTVHVPNRLDPLRADRHATLEQLWQVGGYFDSKKVEPPRLICAFVRHPIAWYESWWKYSIGRPHNWDEWIWHPTYPLQPCRHADFGQFIDNVLTQRPGFLANLFDTYTGATVAEIMGVQRMVGRVETIAADLAAMLRAGGFELDETILSGVQRQNASDTGYGGRPVWRPGQKEKILAAEKRVIEQWYADERREE